MVVFTCNHCGETLHKPKVEKHYQFICRNYKSITCVDCFKDFRDEEYVAHTKCITEDERYAAKGTYKNGIVKKGEVKQESWLEMIKSICDTEKNLKPSIRNLLDTISGYSNVPRKKPKFINFIKSSSGNRANMKEVEEVWDIIERYKTQKAANNQKNPQNKKAESESQKNYTSEQGQKRSIDSNTIEEVGLKKKKLNGITVGDTENVNKKPKLKLESLEDTSVFQNSELEKPKKIHNKESVSEILEETELIDKDAKQTFNMKEKIIEIIEEKKSISLKKLQKKVLKAYIKATGRSDCDHEVFKKINKKLKKIPNVEVEDDRLVLK